MLPDVGRVADGRQRLAAIIVYAESKKFSVLLPPAYYWLGFSDFRQGRFSDSNKNFKHALRLAEAGNNAFEVQHAAEVLTSNYSNLGELEPALSFASKMVSAKGTYYESLNQSLRDLSTLADLTLLLAVDICAFMGCAIDAAALPNLARWTAEMHARDGVNRGWGD